MPTRSRCEPPLPGGHPGKLVAPPRMKVAIDALSARAGGGQTYLRNLLADAPPDDIEVLLIASSHLTFPGGLPENVTRLDVDAPLVRPLPRAAWSRLRLPGLLRDVGADVLFSPGGTLPGASLPCATATMSRNLLPFDRWQRRKYPLSYKRLRMAVLEHVLLRSMIRADLVIFVSDHARRIIDRRSGGRVRHAVVIPHGVGDVFRCDRPEPARPSWLPPGNHLVYVSNIEPYKSQVEVVRAFAELKRRRQANTKLFLVGPPSCASYERRVREEVTTSHLESHVVLVGAVDHRDLPATYRHAHVGIFASECENCPNVLLEAMAAGRPLAVSDRAPMPEFAGDAVVYFDPSRPDQLCDQLVRLSDDGALRAQLGRRAAARARAFDWTATRRTTWEVLRGATRSAT